MTYLEDYKSLIDRGEIVAGYWIKKELENLVEDLNDPAYIYDTTEAHKRIDFIEHLCTQSKAPYYKKPLVLMPFQKAFIEALYSFRMRDTGKRRFVEALLEIARKNGKTTLCAGLAMYDLFLGHGEDICCASNDDKQAKKIWDELAGMRSRLDPKKRITSQNLVNVRNDKNNNIAFRLSSKANTLDGYNISLTFFDESHDVDEEDHQCALAEACWRSMSAKDEPLFINVTTQGFNRDCYLDFKIADAKRIIEGELEDVHFLPFLFEQDSEQEIWTNPASWEKSNPAIRYGVKKRDKFERDVELGRRDSATRLHLLTKDFNIVQTARQGWLMEEDFSYQTETFDLEDFRGSVYLAAVDLSATTDLSNIKLLFVKPNDKTKYVVTKYFIPEDKLKNSDDREAGASYEKWARAGSVEIHDGSEVEIYKIVDWLYELYKAYKIKPLLIGYDQRYAKEFLDRCDYYGFPVEMLAQGRALSNAMKLTEAELKNKNVNYNNDPVDRWCLRNCCAKPDGLGNIQPVKQKITSRRIDGAVTLIMLFEMFRRHRSDFLEKIGG